MSAARPHLRVVKATGEPRERHHIIDGEVRVFRQHSVCRGCKEPTARGADITLLNGSWWHLDCARTYLAGKPTSQAWIALAEQLVKRPSGFKPREVRVITQALLGIAQPGLTIPEESA